MTSSRLAGATLVLLLLAGCSPPPFVDMSTGYQRPRPTPVPNLPKPAPEPVLDNRYGQVQPGESPPVKESLGWQSLAAEPDKPQPSDAEAHAAAQRVADRAQARRDAEMFRAGQKAARDAASFDAGWRAGSR